MNRFFPNPYASSAGGSAAAAVVAMPSPWTEEKILVTARGLLNRCLANCETPEQLAMHDDTLYSGSLGPRVYLRWRLAKLIKKQNDSDAAAAAAVSASNQEADQLLKDALDVAERASKRHDPKRKPLRRVALLTGSYVGSTALFVALLHQQHGQQQRARDEADRLILHIRDGCAGLPSSECDVLYGRAGALQALIFLRTELNDQMLGTDVAVTLATEILNEGRSYSSANSELGMPLLWEWHHSKYLGAAHGVVGILSTLISLAPAEISALNKSHNMTKHVRETIAKLDDYCFPSGNLDSSIKEGHRDKLVHWCHGAPGHLLLLVHASETLAQEEDGNINNSYLVRAKQIADGVLWQRGLLRKGVGLCHGISGNAYPFLGLGRHDESYIQKAYCFLEFAMDNLSELEFVPDTPYSLYEGLAALGCLVVDMSDPKRAQFPLYF